MKWTSRRVSRRVSKRWLSLAVLLVASSASAQGDAQLSSIDDLDPMRLARAVDRGGDDVVVDALAEPTPSIAALRAAPYMHAPELALPRLVELAAGRDPWLAPAAMRSVSQIAERPLLQGMTRREADSLEDVLAALEALSADEGARADLRGAAALARRQLSFE